jgi:hypothetical protein
MQTKSRQDEKTEGQKEKSTEENKSVVLQSAIGKGGKC